MYTYHTLHNAQDILECCETDNKTTDTGGCDCCYDTWVTDLLTVTARWQKANAIANKKQKHYTNANAWYMQLKTWCDDWEQTDVLANSVYTQCELFIRHLDKVCLVAHKTSHSFEILFCMIKDLYIRVDHLKAKYDDLYKCINCLKRAELDPGTPLRNCLDEYGKKLDAVIATRDDLISKVIIAMELVFDLHDNFCDDYGLKGVLVYWRNVLNGNSDQTKAGFSPEYECCELRPEITFPIITSDYYLDLKKQCDNTKLESDRLNRELGLVQEKRDSLKAGKDGLTSALQLVDPSVRCATV